MNDTSTLTVPKVTGIADKQPQPQCRFSITACLDGFPIEIQGEGKAGDLKTIVDRLKAIGAMPPTAQAASTASNAAGAPLCPVHNSPMKPSRKPGRFYCSKKAEDGEYCRENA